MRERIRAERHCEGTARCHKENAAKRREPLTRQKSKLEWIIEKYPNEWTLKAFKTRGWTKNRYWKTYTDTLKTNMIKIQRARKELKKLIELMNREFYVRTKAQKKIVTRILLKEAKENHERKLKSIKNISKTDSQKDLRRLINYEYGEYVTTEFAEQNNLFFYIDDINTFNPSESVNIENNYIIIPLVANINDLNLKEQRIVIDVSYDWSTSSGRAWGTRNAGFYGGVEDSSAFVERIPSDTGSIISAEDWLKPAEVKKAEAEGRKVKRQGDVFLIEMKRKTDINLPSSHKIVETDEGIIIEHDQHGKLLLQGRRWKAVQRKTMASMGVD